MSKRLILHGLVALGCALVPLGAVVARPEKRAAAAPVSAPDGLEYSLSIRGFSPRDGAAQSAAMRPMIHRAAAFAGMGRQAFPPELLARRFDGFTDVALEVTVGADDSLSDCTPVSMIRRPGNAPGAAGPLPATLGAKACRLLLGSRAFVHGLDQSGRPFGGRVAATLSFRSTSSEALLPPPVYLPPPAASGWPPTQVPYGQIKFTAPDWRAFLPEKLPPQLTTGLWLDVESGGMAADCRIGRPSGTPAFDNAVCAALKSVRHEYRRDWKLTGYPLQAVWDGSSVRLQAPVTPIGASFSAYGPIGEAWRPEGPLPGLASAEVALDIDAAGKLARCRLTVPTFADAYDAASCAMMAGGAGLAAGRDMFGDPQPGTVRLYVDWSDRQIRPKF